MKKHLALLLALMMLVSVFAACGEQAADSEPSSEPVENTEAEAPEAAAEAQEATTEAPETEKVETTTEAVKEPVPTYDVNYKIHLFGDGTLVNIAEYVTALANAENIGITVFPSDDTDTPATKKAAIYDTSNMEAEKASSYNLYEIYSFTDDSGEATKDYANGHMYEKDSGTAGRFFPTLWEGNVDFYIMETGRDRNLFEGLTYGEGSRRVLKQVIDDYYGEGSTNGEIILYAPPAYLDGSVAFDLTTKVVTDGPEATFVERTGGISTNADHIAAIKEYANTMKEVAGDVAELVYMCDAFAAYEDPASLYTEWGATPSDAGRYLEACVFFAMITGKSPVGNSYTAELDAAVAASLQQAAEDLVFVD